MLNPELWRQLTDTTSYHLEVVNLDVISINDDHGALVLLVNPAEPAVAPFPLLFHLDLSMLLHLGVQALAVHQLCGGQPPADSSPDT